MTDFEIKRPHSGRHELLTLILIQHRQACNPMAHLMPIHLLIKAPDRRHQIRSLKVIMWLAPHRIIAKAKDGTCRLQLAHGLDMWTVLV